MKDNFVRGPFGAKFSPAEWENVYPLRDGPNEISTPCKRKTWFYHIFLQEKLDEDLSNLV